MSYKTFFNKVKSYHQRLNSVTTEYDLTPFKNILKEINRCKSNFENKSDNKLINISKNLVMKARKDGHLDNLLVETYALVQESVWRVLQLHPFNVQLIGAIAMHWGKIVQMQTGEGKTLAAVFPAVLNALSGNGVHILTVNDYLARRDAKWMGSVYERMGLRVAFIQEGMNTLERQKAYKADVTYATANEAGFDFLRDHLCTDRENLVQRPFNFAILDEIDSILIDEARIPLVVAGESLPPEIDRLYIDDTVKKLRPGIDYTTDLHERNVFLTDTGISRIESIPYFSNLYNIENINICISLNLALHAHALLKRDIDYLVRNERVELIDELKGRVADKRRWPHGLHAAIEAKERVPHTADGQILSSITLQHFIHLYPDICGMTATAETSAEEFKNLYNLNVQVIPPNLPSVRIDHPDIIFTHTEAKEKALIKEIINVHKTGRPILVGTGSVKESEHLASMLQKAGIFSEVLNARNDELEAEIIINAGSVGAVTISTNMAGRGTDIRLGGKDEHDKSHVSTLGGLYLIGTCRHDSVRIDNQLRGRAGRQGDPGSSRFFISLEDELIQQYELRTLIPGYLLNKKLNKPINNASINRDIQSAQRMIDGQNAQIRKTLGKYSQVIEIHRRIIHKRREDVLLGKNHSYLQKIMPGHSSEIINRFGRDLFQLVETSITLAHIDQAWADHLARLSEIREEIITNANIFGKSYGGFLGNQGRDTPIMSYTHQAKESFDRLLVEVDANIAATFKKAVINDTVLILSEKLMTPGSTWTYLITDEQFDDGLIKFVKISKHKFLLLITNFYRYVTRRIIK